MKESRKPRTWTPELNKTFGINSNPLEVELLGVFVGSISSIGLQAKGTLNWVHQRVLRKLELRDSPLLWSFFGFGFTQLQILDQFRFLSNLNLSFSLWLLSKKSVGPLSTNRQYRVPNRYLNWPTSDIRGLRVSESDREEAFTPLLNPSLPLSLPESSVGRSQSVYRTKSSRKQAQQGKINSTSRS